MVSEVSSENLIYLWPTESLDSGFSFTLSATAIIEAGMWSRSGLIHWDHTCTGKFTFSLKYSSDT